MTKTEKMCRGGEITNVGELIGFCLKSKSFDLLLAVMIGVVWCGAILLRQYLYGKDSTAALLAFYVFPIFVGMFFVAMYGSMKSVTRKINKSASAEVLFTIVIILIPMFVFFYFPLDILES